MVARDEMNGNVIMFEQQTGFASQNDDPFMFVLIVPKAVGTGVLRGDNALDAHVFRLDDRLDKFFRQLTRQIGEQVSHLHSSAVSTSGMCAETPSFPWNDGHLPKRH